MGSFTKRWYLNSVNLGGATTYLFWDEDFDNVPSGSNYSNSGWNVGRNNAGNYARLDNGSEVSRNSFSGSLPTAGADDSVFNENSASIEGNAYDDDGTNTVVAQRYITTRKPFHATYWDYDWDVDISPFQYGSVTVSLDVQADSRANGQDGRIQFHLYKSFFTYNGGTSSLSKILLDSTSTPIGTYLGVGSTVTNLTTTTSQTSSGGYGINASAYDTAGTRVNSNLGYGYLMTEIVWEITGAGGGGGAGNNNDVILMYGQSTSSYMEITRTSKRIHATQ